MYRVRVEFADSRGTRLYVWVDHTRGAQFASFLREWYRRTNKPHKVEVMVD